MKRRVFLAGSLAIIATPAFAATPRFKLRGAMEQGSLILVSTEAGAKITVDGKPVRVTAKGEFAFGFAYDQAKPSVVTATFADGEIQSDSVTPIRRQYDIQRVDGLPQNTVTPPPEVLERIRRETVTIVAARSRDSEGDDFFAGFDWPAPGIESGVFGSQRIDNGVPMAPHYGVDMAAPTGTPIHAPASGIVAVTADHYVNGGFTLIDHGQGVSTSYLHQSKRLVREGQRVTRGQVIGHIGQTGRATGPHLHWAMNWFQVRLDPSRSTKKPKPEPL